MPGPRLTLLRGRTERRSPPADPALAALRDALAARVASVPPPNALRRVGERVDAWLFAHVARLRARLRGGAAPR